MNRLSLLAITGIIAGTLTSCAGQATDVSSSTPPHVPSSTLPSTPVATAEAEQDAGGASTPIDADPRSCLHGTWLADNAFFLTRLQELADVIHEVSGQVVLRFDADGTLTADYQDWTLSGGAQGVDTQITRAGVDTGTYSATEDVVDLHETDMGSALVVTVGGLDMTIAPQPAVYHGAVYSCGHDAATIETVDGVLRLTRQ